MKRSVQLKPLWLETQMFEQAIPDMAREKFDFNEIDDDFIGVFRFIMLALPSFSIYGGTREILRSIIGRALAHE